MSQILRRGVLVGGDPLAVRLVGPRRPRGTVFVPPLIGGSGMQQVRFHRELERLGYRLATFDYRGHGKSGGRFSILGTLRDTRAALELVRREDPGQPLFGLAECYGCIPLLKAVQASPGSLDALVLFNPVPSLQHIAGPLEVWLDHMAPRGADGQRCPQWCNPFDLAGMVLTTNTRLFPSVDKSRGHFGILSYERTRTWQAVLEFLFLRPLARLRVPTPAQVWFGRDDELLRLNEPGMEEHYRRVWTRMLPRAEVRMLAGADHYWNGVQARADRLTASFFERTLAVARTAPVSGSPASLRLPTTSSVA